MHPPDRWRCHAKVDIRGTGLLSDFQIFVHMLQRMRFNRDVRSKTLCGHGNAREIITHRNRARKPKTSRIADPWELFFASRLAAEIGEAILEELDHYRADHVRSDFEHRQCKAGFDQLFL